MRAMILRACSAAVPSYAGSGAGLALSRTSSMDSRENHLRPDHCPPSSAKTAPANLIGDLRDGKTCTTRLQRFISLFARS